MSEQPTSITGKEHEASEDNKVAREPAAGNNQGRTEGGQSSVDESRALVGRRRSEVSESDSAAPEPIMVVDPRLICPRGLEDMPHYNYYQSSTYIEPAPYTENTVCVNMSDICYCIVSFMNRCLGCIWNCLGTCRERLRANVESGCIYMLISLDDLRVSLSRPSPSAETPRRRVSHEWAVKYAKNAAETENLMHETEL